jgi:hypothetical protein
MKNVRPSRPAVSGLLLAAPLAVAFALTGAALGTASPARSEHLALTANVDCVTGNGSAVNPSKLPDCLGD